MAVLAFAFIAAGVVGGTGAAFLTAFTVAYAVGSALFPPKGPHTQSSQGLLEDLRVTGSEYGQPIPWVAGSLVLAGQMWWNTDRRPIYTSTTVDTGGKGGGGGSSTQTTITYEMDCFLGLTDNPIIGISRIWRNGELIYNTRVDASYSTLQASVFTPHWRRLTVYEGGASQLPDPTYEAFVGTPNAIGYRDRAGVFIEGLNLGQTGQVPNLTFEVVVAGSTALFGISAVPLITLASGYNALVEGSGGGGGRLYSGADDFHSVQTYSMKTGALLAQHNFGAASLLPVGGGSEGSLWLAGSDAALYRLDANGTLDWIPSNLYPHTALVYEQSPLRVWAYSALLEMPTLYIRSPSVFDSHAAVASTPISFAGWARIVPIVNATWLPDRYYVCAQSTVGVLKIGYFHSVTQTSVTVFTGTGNGNIRPVMDRNGNIWTFGADAVRNRLTVLTQDGSLVTVVDLPGVDPFLANGGAALAVTAENVIYVSASVSATANVPYRILGVDADTAAVLFTTSDLTDAFRFVEAPEAPRQFIQKLVTGAGLDEIYVGAVKKDATLVTATTPSVQSVVESICLRAGLSAGQFDTSGLVSIANPVRGFAWPGATPARQALEQLAAAFYFEINAREKLYFRPRGATPVATIPYLDLGATENEDETPALELRETNDIEIPAQVNLSYLNVDNDYQPDVQITDRLISVASNTIQSATLSVALKPTEARAIAETMLLDQVASRYSSSLRVLADRTALEPADVLTVIGPDGTNFRMRITKRTDNFPVLGFDVVLDDAAALVVNGITSLTYQNSTAVAFQADTLLQLLDIPILRDADNDGGFYIAAKGDVAPYPGAAILSSVDDIEYSTLAINYASAVFGFTRTALSDYTGWRIFDETGSVTVAVDTVLNTSTRDAVLGNASVNAMLIGNEVIQFRTATLVSAGVYTLSGLLRGGRGTEWAMTAHSIGERAVLLTTAGMVRVALGNNQIGLPQYYKGVTLGRSASTAVGQAFTCNAVGLKPFSPFDLRGSRDASNNITLTWQRRSRLQVRMIGALGISVPLDDASEFYDVEFWNAGYTTRVRLAQALSAPTFVYTAAMQTADGVSLGATVFMRLYQLSSIAGRGTVLQASA